MTSWHALKNVARLRKGETALIHAGAGGVGMAAVQIAHHLGAEVIASAGSPAKRTLLQTLGVKHVIDSRRGDFAEAVMELTDRRGVDVVLNALAGEAIPMGLGCLAEFGRFVEIGKRDIYQNSRIPLRPLRRNASFHVVAMDAVFAGDESLTREMLKEISDLVEQRALYPLPFRAFPANNVGQLFGSWRAGSTSARSSFRSRKHLCRGAENPSHQSSKSSRMGAISLPARSVASEKSLRTGWSIAARGTGAFKPEWRIHARSRGVR
jgi:NADPH:quinone reductase and related Zn-dependent oxidoreductases